MTNGDARAAYEAIYTEWLAEERMVTIHKTTAARLLGELVKLADAERERTGRWGSSIEPGSVFGLKP